MSGCFNLNFRHFGLEALLCAVRVAGSPQQHTITYGRAGRDLFDLIWGDGGELGGVGRALAGFGGGTPSARAQARLMPSRRAAGPANAIQAGGRPG